MIPQEVHDLAQKRLELRGVREFEKADKIRLRLAKMGYEIQDAGDSYTITKQIAP